ncbi:MAG: ABC transporter substrate-binding protein [Lachnospiraceae bacterium]|jgi:raffinose/stachyose/melibiose transport system substrate-binding protein|nr:ABC transporter substrate-binding protein [Lachnospiraceae bacterium]MCH4031949.1 ABC transporter substrate-binding protein [Lachnospiraceae bacterium]MCH4070572.1 ABC transporter substrate-binding protein [Lachnospiraceae bacterium]MCH4109240.1 ABC transporter substrate-binding protein [Lachnospiraceae bacterium]MCI1303199.1 ABC transporter substrate-binding protein [Lachnospiraceae bacterium]
MRKQAYVCTLLSAAMVAGTLAGCGTTSSTTSSQASSSKTSETTSVSASSGGKTTDLSGQELEIATYLSGDTLAAYKQVLTDFEQESGVKITLDEYGDDYESTMKTRMASNDLPDVFETHGWSLIRYKEYLTDLSGESWAKDLSKAALGVIQDTDGKIYTLMTTGSCLGTSVNMNVCEKAGVDPWSIETWEDFNAACDKIKAAGYTPIGNYFTSAGALANADGSWLSYKGEQYDDNEAILNGTWDWADYKTILDYLATWFDNGYLYEDAGTIKQNDVIERTARDECAFVVGIGTSFQAAVTALNSDAKMAMIPICASKEGGARFVGIGEGASFGIWKDTKHMGAAKALLNYIAEHADPINAAAGEISTLPSETTKSYGMQMMEEMESHFPDVFYDNLWDRKYMPSGMWSIFQVAAGNFYSDHSEAGKQAVISYLKENYDSLYEAAKAG